MMIETWDRTSLGEQEDIIGRTKGEGAALGQAKEFDEIDLKGLRGDGDPQIPVDAHVRLAHPETNKGARLLRRGYNFVDGSDGLGRLNAGLFFIAFQKDPRSQFVPLQRKLAANDALNEYIEHVGSGLFACPPGVSSPGDFWGSALFA
jgi:deferrochelatase/peroxidase EfeB